MAITEKLIKKGVGWKLTKNNASGNYIVYHSKKSFIFHPNDLAGANLMIKAFKRVQKKLSTPLKSAKNNKKGK